MNEIFDIDAGPVSGAEWDRAAKQIPGFNDLVRRDVKISHAMEAVMRTNADAGTMVAVYLGGHPKESLDIAHRTITRTRASLLLAAHELTAIHVKLVASKTGSSA